MGLNLFIDQKKQTLSEKGVMHLRVKVNAGSNKNEFVELLDDGEDTLKIRITAPADKGKANKEIVKFIGKFFGGTCEIIAGHTHNIKLLKIK